MRLALDWLAEWIDLPPDAELVERLDMGGFEDAAIERSGPDLSGLRVGRVLERAAHPDADRLSVCRVDAGDGEVRTIVCGAPNVAAGQKVAVALPGTALPDGTRIEASRIRGVVSQGMLCSARELGLGGEHAGILVLETGAEPGAPLAAALAGGERVLEVGITPNRGDLASLIGVAREVQAHFGSALRAPGCAPPESGAPASAELRIAIEAPDACHRYVARIVRGVRPGPSPDWMQRRLAASGMRAIDIVVDVTNYVLLEFGQPLHAFDLATLRGGEIRVRRARAGEKLATLDGETRELDAQDLVIADAERAIALAGVMGGAATQVGEATRDVLIESAHFHPTAVRLAARRHGIHSEAAYRFERGVDREGIARAADRAARLLAELAGGRVAPGAVIAEGEAPPITREIRLEAARANRLLGTGLAASEMAALLERVGVRCREAGPGALVGSIPSHRNDLHIHQDLVEEVARIHGYDRIPTTLPVARLEPVTLPRSRVLAERAKDALAGCGLLETVSFPFLAPADLAGLRLPEGDPRRRVLRVQNPITAEEPLLRTSLVPTLLRLVRANRSRQAARVGLFEVSRVFRATAPGELPEEPLHAAAVLATEGPAGLWEREPPRLFFRLRGIAERLLNQLGYVSILRREAGPPYLHPGAAAELEVGGRVVGAIGELHPDVARHFELDVPCGLVELELSALAAQPPPEVRFREVSRFPAVRRDLAVLLPSELAAGDVLEALRKSAGPDCVSVELFDRYEGRGVPEGRVSLAFRLVFQRADRTLQEREVTPAIERVVRMLAHRFGGELR